MVKSSRGSQLLQSILKRKRVLKPVVDVVLLSTCADRKSKLKMAQRLQRRRFQLLGVVLPVLKRGQSREPFDYKVSDCLFPSKAEEEPGSALLKRALSSDDQSDLPELVLTRANTSVQSKGKGRKYIYLTTYLGVKSAKRERINSLTETVPDETVFTIVKDTTAIVGNQPLTEAEELYQGVSLLVDEDIFAIVNVCPLIIEISHAYIDNQLVSRTSQQLGCQTQGKTPQTPNISRETEETGNSADTKLVHLEVGGNPEVPENRIKRMIVSKKHIGGAGENLDLSLDLDDLQNLGVETNLLKRKTEYREPEAEYDSEEPIEASKLGSKPILNAPQSQLQVQEGPQARRAGPGKTIAETTPVSWTLMGKRITPVFQDVHINRWPIEFKESSRSKSPKVSRTFVETDTEHIPAKTGPHPWQGMLREFGQSFDDSSDDDIIKRAISTMKQNLHEGLKNIDRRKPQGEPRNQKLISEILLKPEGFVSAGNTGKAKQTETKSQEQTGLVRVYTPAASRLQAVLADTRSIEVANRESTKDVLHKSPAELAAESVLSCSSEGENNSQRDFEEEVSPITTKAWLLIEQQLQEAKPNSCQRLLRSSDSAEEEFL